MDFSSLKLRNTILVVIISVILGMFGLRLVKLQIVEHEKYQQLGNMQVPVTQTVTAARGEIVDRYGRPMVINRTGFNVVFDRSFLPKGGENEIILKLLDLMQQAGEEWNDSLPMEKEEPFDFLEEQKAGVARLKKLLELESYATAEDSWHWLKERYKLADLDCTEREKRLVAGVRYEMEQRGFNARTRYTFAEDISVSTMAKIKEASFEMPGVDVEESSIRDYVSGDIAPHLMGRIGPIDPDELESYLEKGYKANEQVGKEGIEGAFEEQLRGENGTREITYQNGEVLKVVETKSPKPGDTVVLTLDRELEKVTQLALENRIKQLQVERKPGEGREANAGAAVVIKVKTGEVLAAATYPSYDLSTYRQDYAENALNPLNPFYNRALLGKYAPGSTYKPIVATAALNEGLVDASTDVFCGGTYLYFAPSYTPSCMYVHQDIDVERALAVSCNIYFYDVGRRLGINTVDKYAKGFGFGEKTGIEVPERIGQRDNPAYREEIDENWYPGDAIQVAIGQGKNGFSPLQIANYAATLANGGKRMETHLVRDIVSYNFEETVKEVQPVVVSDLNLSKEAQTVVRQGMVDTSTKSYGTAYSVFGNYPITVAAKTGTPEATGIDLNAVFIAYAPAEDPEIAVAVVIEKGYNGYLCSPVAKAVFDQYFFADRDAQKPIRAETPLP